MPTDDLPPLATRACLNCGLEFPIEIKAGNPRKFHNDECRARYRNRMARVRTARRTVKETLLEAQEKIHSVHNHLTILAGQWRDEDEKELEGGRT